MVRRSRKAADLLGLCQCCVFFSGRFEIIKNGPSERRRFVDMELCQLDNFYLYNLNHNNKIVNQSTNSLAQRYVYESDLKET